MSERKKLQLGSVQADLERNRLEGAGRCVELEPRVCDVLEVLHAASGRVVTRDQIIESVWSDYPGADQSLTNTVSKLRSGLREAGADSMIVQTIPKRGYRLDVPTTGASKRSARRLFGWVAGLGAVLLGVFLVIAFMPAKSGTARVAILPFAAVGDSVDQDLVRGIGQAVSSRMAALGRLQLVHGDQAILPTDALEAIETVLDGLDADFVLTGSVRIQGDSTDRLQLAVQLLRASDGATVWGEVAEGGAGDLFDLEDRIARNAAAAVPGSGYVAADMQRGEAPTANRIAYKHFLRAIGNSRRALPTAEEVGDAYQALQRAVELDPGFASAWAEMSIVLGLQERWEVDDVRWNSRKALERARSLAPDQPDVLIAQGLYLVREGDHASADTEISPGALESLLRALRQRPHSTRALAALVPVLQHEGRFELAVEAAELAVRRAPADSAVLRAAVDAHNSRRHWARSEELLQKLIELEPERYVHWHGLARMRLMATGDVRSVRETLNEAPEGLVPDKVRAEFDQYARDPERTRARVREQLEKVGVDAFVARNMMLALYAGFAERELGGRETANRLAASAQRLAREGLSRHPDHISLLLVLAYASSLGQQHELAVATACRAIRANGDDVSRSRSYAEMLARMLAQSGRTDQALTLIDWLSRMDYGRTPLNRHELVLHPSWDPLRKRDAFERVVERAPVSRRWSDDGPERASELIERIRMNPATAATGVPEWAAICGQSDRPDTRPRGMR